MNPTLIREKHIPPTTRISLPHLGAPTADRGHQHVIAFGPRGEALRTHAQRATEAHPDHVAIGACEGDALHGDRCGCVKGKVSLF